MNIKCSLWRILVVLGKIVNELLKRLHLLLVHKVELADEVVEVLEACVEMSFLS